MPTISEAGREVLKKWQEMGVKFLYLGYHGCFSFEYPANDYAIPEQLVPEQWDVKHLYKAINEGLKVNSGDGLCEVRIPAQTIPKELLEMEELGTNQAKQFWLASQDNANTLEVKKMEEPKKKILIHHIPERKLWLSQREAGTNEQWKVKPRSWNDWKKIPIDEEPEWSEYYDYTTVNTVKYYFCLCRRKNGDIVSMSRTSKETLKHAVAVGDATIIGNIEEHNAEV